MNTNKTDKVDGVDSTGELSHGTSQADGQAPAGIVDDLDLDTLNGHGAKHGGQGLTWRDLARRAMNTADGNELMHVVDRLLRKLEDKPDE